MIKKLLMLLGLLAAPAAGAATPQEFHKKMQQHPETTVLVDVRESEELGEGMAQGARHIPLSDVKNDGTAWKGLLSSLEAIKKKGASPEVGVYCRSGVRSARMIESLKAKGFGADNLGGFADWKKAGLPVQTSPAR